MKNNFFGNYILILHCHIPYVLHHDRMNEEWLYEAVAETYIPLLNIFHRLISRGISPQLTINISPVLAEQLVTDYFKKGFQNYCDQKMFSTMEDEKFFLENDPQMLKLSTLWRKFYFKTKQSFTEKYHCDLIKAFRRMQEAGHLELVTCGATHGYLPALSEDTSINAQIRMAKASYERLFGKPPSGIWLPELGYRPSCQWTHPLTHRRCEPSRYRRGLEEFLAENGISYFFIDQEQFKKASPEGIDKTPWSTYSISNPSIKENPVTAFVRDTGLSEQIWNFEKGYPGNGDYLDFHKKHWGSGNRYWKITDKKLDMAYKQVYSYKKVPNLIIQHAGHYKWSIKKTLEHQFLKTNELGLKVAAFDAELFGHWWFEGPKWIYELLKWIHSDPEMALITCSTYRKQFSPTQEIQLPESSWGKNADSSTWINPKLEWVWERIYSAEKQMRHLANHFREEKDELLQRILRQGIRELLILQSSDWEFMITNNSTKDHGERRIVEHHNDFTKLAKIALKWEKKRSIDKEDLTFLKECEHREEIFVNPDPNWYL